MLCLFDSINANAFEEIKSWVYIKTQKVHIFLILSVIFVYYIKIVFNILTFYIFYLIPQLNGY